MTEDETEKGHEPMKRSDLERLYDAYAQGLFHFLLGMTRAEPDARDLLQDLFVKLARNEGVLDGVANEKAFLFRMARNAAVDWARRGKIRTAREEQSGPYVSALFEPSPDPDEARFRECLKEGLDTLPAEQRAAVFLKLWQGLTFQEIAEIESISANTAASRYRYGIDKLRDLLRPLYEEIK